MLNEKIIARHRDQFYTQEVVADSCLQQLLSIMKIEKPVWLEPSAGTGVFLSLLEKINYPYIAYDIEPKYKNIKEQNFLDVTFDDIKNNLLDYDGNNLITIGNPPFGKNASLAIRFFNHASKYSQIIAMILPATFEKKSVQKRLDKNMHLVKSIKLENDLFYFENKLVAVPTVFQIWEKRKEKRLIIDDKLISDYFNFTIKDNANFAIQRVGGAAGKVKRNVKDLSITSHYFIQADNYICEAFEKINWDKVKFNTAGNPSISKGELIILLEENLNK